MHEIVRFSGNFIKFQRFFGFFFSFFLLDESRCRSQSDSINDDRGGSILGGNTVHLCVPYGSRFFPLLSQDKSKRKLQKKKQTNQQTKERREKRNKKRGTAPAETSHTHTHTPMSVAPQIDAAHLGTFTNQNRDENGTPRRRDAGDRTISGFSCCCCCCCCCLLLWFSG